MSGINAVQSVVQSFLSSRGCAAPQRVLAAVSGGGDSLALWHALTAYAAEGGPAVTAVHVHHGLRGADADADAAFTAQTAAAWQVPLETVYLQLPPGSTPAAARRARYQALAACAARLQAAAVLTAHQADDQAETVLHHLLRGSGTAGLRGMAAETPATAWAADSGAVPTAPLWRPLLSLDRALLAAYCREVGLTPREDATNVDQRYLRPRLRRQLFPLLRAENPQFTAAIGRTARLLADDYAFISQELARRWPQLVQHVSASEVALHRPALRAEHPALQRAAVRHSAALLGVRELSQAATDHLVRLAGGLTAARTPTVAGLWCVVDQHRWVLQSAATAPIDGPQLLNDGAAPADARWAEGWTTVVQGHAPPQPDHWWLAISPTQLSRAVWRHRRAGDRMRPRGAPGSRRIQDIMVDRRIPQAARQHWPLLLLDDVIVWIPGAATALLVPDDGQTRATIWIGVVRTEPHEQE